MMPNEVTTGTMCACTPTREVMTMPQAAEYLGCHPLTIRSHIRAGRIPFSRFGRMIRIRKADIDHMLESNLNRRWEGYPTPAAARKEHERAEA